MLNPRIIINDLTERASGPLKKLGRALAHPGEYQSRRQTPVLDSQFAGCAEHLRRAGYTAFPATAAPVAQMLDLARSLHETAAIGERTDGKKFFRNLVDAGTLADHPVFLQVALDPAVIQTIAAAYGHLPYLESIELLLTLPDTGPLSQSQHWHYDRVDTWAVKQFIYVYDVDADCGPFTLLPRDASETVPGYLPHYIPDETMRRHVDENRVVALTGAAGSRLLIDVRNCFHFGSRSKKPRLAFVAYYNTGFGYYPRMQNWRSSGIDFSGMTDLQRRVLGLPSGRAQ